MRSAVKSLSELRNIKADHGFVDVIGLVEDKRRHPKLNGVTLHLKDETDYDFSILFRPQHFNLIRRVKTGESIVYLRNVEHVREDGMLRFRFTDNSSIAPTIPRKRKKEIEEYLIEYPAAKSIAAIHEEEYDFEDNKKKPYRIIARVELMTGEYTYTGCLNCMTKLAPVEDTDELVCKKCRNNNPKKEHFYKIMVMLVDGNAGTLRCFVDGSLISAMIGPAAIFSSWSSDEQERAIRQLFQADTYYVVRLVGSAGKGGYGPTYNVISIDPHISI